MPIHFSLDSRANRKGEYPIRFTWSRKGVRFQSTTGYSVPESYWFAPIQRVVCSSKDELFPKMDEVYRLLEDITRFTKDVETRFDRAKKALSRERMKSIMHAYLSGDAEYIVEQQLQKEEAQTLYMHRGKDKHYYEKITEARDQATGGRMVVYRRLSGRRLTFVASESYFLDQFVPVNK